MKGFQLKWSKAADAQFKEILKNAESTEPGSKQAGLAKQVQKSLALLQQNPRHPSLNTHPYSGYANPYKTGKHVWEAYAQNRTAGAYRIFWCYGPLKGWITVIAITPHP